MGYAFAAHDEPAWHYWLDYRRDTFEAFATDGLQRGTHPIVLPVNWPSEISALFDVLTYEKGGALLRMLQTAMTPDLYWAGIRAYLTAHRYGNTEPADFWTALEEATQGRVPVRQLAKEWFEQEGYPIVHAELVGANALRLTQRRFLSNGDTSDPTLWTVPMTLRYSRSGTIYTQQILLHERATTVSLWGAGPLDWVYTNSGETGYYRTAFAPPLFDTLLTALPQLEPIEAMGLMNNLWAQAQAGGSIAPLLKVMAALRHTDNRFLLEDISHYVREIGDKLVTTPAQRAAFDRFVERQFAHHWARLGWSTAQDTDEDKLSRAAVLAILGPRRPAIVQEAREWLMRYLADPTALDPTLVVPVLEVVSAADGTEALLTQLVEALQHYQTPEQKDNYLRHGFTGFTDPQLITRFLDMTLATDTHGQDLISKQDAWIPIGALLRAAPPQDTAWRWVQAHFPQLKHKVGERAAARIIGATGALWHAGASHEIHAFFTRPENQVDSATFVLPQSEEMSHNGANFTQQQQSILQRALEETL